MKKTKFSGWGLGLVTLIGLGLCFLGGQMLYMLQRQNQLRSRPLVLIHNPVNHEQLQSGDAVSLRATARAANGVDHMEVWIDGRFYISLPAGEAGAHSPFILDQLWQPSTSGPHVIQVRAVSANHVEGQSAITVEVYAAKSDTASTHTVQEGESFASVAEQFEVTPEELAALNPGADPAGTAAGDELNVPPVDYTDDGTSPAAPEGPAPEDSEPPVAGGPEPGSFQEMLLLFGFDLSALLDPPSSDPVGLKLEILSLRTAETYDSLHCYMGAGEMPVRWYPDSDHDQATDEYFTLGDDGWNVADYFAGGSTRVLAWPGNEPLPFGLECVGIQGGTDAIPAGALELTVQPQEWDGVTRAAVSAGEGASFEIEYRLSRTDSAPGIPIEIDPMMAAPTNLWVEDRRHALHWDYSEENIDGFRIYLNGNLQWSVNYRARQSDLPPQWFHPPCGDEYVLSVSAYRNQPGTEVSESNPATPPVTIVTPPEECNKRIAISFIALNTFNLGGDGHHEHRSGNVGPVYGDFFVNEQEFSIDTRPSDSWGGSLDQAIGLSHNSSYSFADMLADPGWRLSGFPNMVVELEPGGAFQYGFSLRDEDTGWCNDGRGPGCDDPICEGLSVLYQDHFGQLDTVHEEALRSDDGRCEVTVRFEPTGNSVVGSAGDAPALPRLQVQNYHFEDATSTIHFDIANTGTGTWPGQPLDIWLTDREANRIDTLFLREFRLEPGQTRAMEYVSHSIPPELCIVLDPNNTMPELNDNTEALDSRFLLYCPPLPDLIITGAEYDAEAGQIQVTVQNTGEGDLENRTVEITIPRASTGSDSLAEAALSNVYLGRYDSVVVPIPITPELRETLTHGYIIDVDPENRVAEENETNNRYSVGGRAQYWVAWYDGCSDAYVRGLTNDIHMRLRAYILGGAATHELFNWSAPELSLYLPIGYNPMRVCWGYDHGFYPATFNSEQFFLMDDEKLRLDLSTTVDAGAEHYSVGGWEVIIDPNSDGDVFNDPNYPDCNAVRGDPGYYNIHYDYPGEGRRPDPGEWSTLIMVCRHTTGDE